MNGNQYTLGSDKLVSGFQPERTASCVCYPQTQELVGWIDLADELRPEAKDVIRLPAIKKHQNHFIKR